MKVNINTLTNVIIKRLKQFDNLVIEAKTNKKLLATFLIKDFMNHTEDNSPSLDIEDFKLFLIEEGYNKDGAIIHAVMSPLEKYLNEKLTKNVANEETH